MNTELPQKRVKYVRDFAKRIVSENYPTLSPEDLPIDANKIAKNLGFEVHDLDSIDDKQSAIILRDAKLIGLNKKHHYHRTRFSLGHELGHFLLHHPTEEDCTPDEIKVYNQEADEFAAELLVPYALLKQLIKSNSTDQLSARFRVSRDVIIIRAQQTRLFAHLS